MEEGDINTKKTWKVGGSCAIVLDKDWLLYLGVSEKEIETGEVELVFKAVRNAKKQPSIEFGKRVET